MPGWAARIRRAAVAKLTTQNPDFLRKFTADFRFGDEFGAQRTRNIANAFLAGYNVLARGGGPDEVHTEADRIPRFYRPFLYEGAAMGFGPFAWHSRCGLSRFEDFVADLSQPTLYQNYVGFGWWLATIYRRRPRRVARIVSGLDFRYRLLCYEGIGFRAGFMSAGRQKTPTVVVAGDIPATHLWYQGYGRSLWFVYMGDIVAASRAAMSVEPTYVGDCISGLGVGVAFSYLDRIEELARFHGAIPKRFVAEFEQGLSFGWEARQLADRDLFDENVGRLPRAVRDAIEERITDVHRVRDGLLAAGERTDFYNRWRRELVALRRKAAPLRGW